MENDCIFFENIEENKDTRESPRGSSVHLHLSWCLRRNACRLSNAQQLLAGYLGPFSHMPHLVSGTLSTPCQLSVDTAGSPPNDHTPQISTKAALSFFSQQRLLFENVLVEVHVFDVQPAAKGIGDCSSWTKEDLPKLRPASLGLFLRGPEARLWSILPPLQPRIKEMVHSCDRQCSKPKAVVAELFCRH